MLIYFYIIITYNLYSNQSIYTHEYNHYFFFFVAICHISSQKFSKTSFTGMLLLWKQNMQFQQYTKLYLVGYPPFLRTALIRWGQSELDVPDLQVKSRGTRPGLWLRSALLLLGFFRDSTLSLDLRFSIRFKSRLFPGQCRTVIWWSPNHFMELLALWHGAPSCWKIHFRGSPLNKSSIVGNKFRLQHCFLILFGMDIAINDIQTSDTMPGHAAPHHHTHWVLHSCRGALKQKIFPRPEQISLHHSRRCWFWSRRSK